MDSYPTNQDKSHANGDDVSKSSHSNSTFSHAENPIYQREIKKRLPRTPRWIEALFEQGWSPENSLAVDRWLAYLEQEFPQRPKPRTPLHCSYLDDHNKCFRRLKAVIASVAELPKELQPTALRAVSIANGLPLDLVQQVWKQVESKA